MSLTLRLTAVSVLCVAPGFCQLIAEHAAAVAGGGMGVIAGKPVSDGISKVMGNVEKAPTQKSKPLPAAAPKATQQAPEPKSAPVSHSAAGSSSASSYTPSPSSAAPAPRRARTASVAAAIQNPEPIVEVARPIEALVEPDLSKAAEGMKREDLMAAVGAPASRVTIPEEEHLLEIYRYSYGDRWIGTIRLDNGQVIRIDTPR